MKNSVSLALLISIFIVNNCIAQRIYIDLTGCETINDPNKDGWIRVFQDRFPSTMPDPPPYAPTMEDCWIPDDEKRIIQSDQQWKWWWGIYSRAADPFYDNLGNILLNQSDGSDQYLTLTMNYVESGVNPHSRSLVASDCVGYWLLVS